MAANTAEVRETALSLDAAFSDERAAPSRPGRIAIGRQDCRLRRDHTRIVAAALIVSAVGCLILGSALAPKESSSLRGHAIQRQRLDGGAARSFDGGLRRRLGKLVPFHRSPWRSINKGSAVLRLRALRHWPGSHTRSADASADDHGRPITEAYIAPDARADDARTDGRRKHRWRVAAQCYRARRRGCGNRRVPCCYLITRRRCSPPAPLSRSSTTQWRYHASTRKIVVAGVRNSEILVFLVKQPYSSLRVETGVFRERRDATNKWGNTSIQRARGGWIRRAARPLHSSIQRHV